MDTASRVRKGVLIGFTLFMAIFRTIKVFSPYGAKCQSDWLTPLEPCKWVNMPFEMLLWGIVLLLLLLELIWDHDFKGLFRTCRSSWPVFLFILLAFLSLFWSILFNVTLYKVIVLLMSTVLAVYSGRMLGVHGFLNGLTWFFAVLCIANIGAVLFFPEQSIMNEEIYHRAWNGIFWHRNYMGCFMAMAIAIYLIKLFDWRNLSRFAKVTTLFMTMISFFLLMKSKSATGIITAVVLIAVCLIMATWIQWRKYLKPLHYVLLLGLAVIVIALGLSHLDFFFGLLGRNTSLTGRVPLWNYLFQEVIHKRPILGYGYGAIWYLEGFRIQLSQILGWTYQVMIGDNGLVDIWLHLGIVGVLLILGLIVTGIVRAVRYLLRERTITSALPLVLLAFVVVANISLSLILESETFVWMVVIASQVGISATNSRTTEG